MKRQDLVNAQVNVNRAVWAINAISNREEPVTMTQREAEAYIDRCINDAIEDLRKAQGKLL